MATKTAAKKTSRLTAALDMLKPKSKDDAPKPVQVAIRPPRLKTVEFLIIGTAPLVSAAFSQKLINKISEQQRAGSQAKSKKVREPRDFEADCEGAIHRSTDNWVGVPASAFRSAAISACRLIGFKMTLAKLAIFIEADGLDAATGQPLVRLIAGKNEVHIGPVRNATGVMDLRARPMWREWKIALRVRFDLDVFSEADVANLIARVGEQVGIGEGRHDSRESTGLGWGTFRLAGDGDDE